MKVIAKAKARPGRHSLFVLSPFKFGMILPKRFRPSDDDPHAHTVWACQGSETYGPAFLELASPSTRRLASTAELSDLSWLASLMAMPILATLTVAEGGGYWLGGFVTISTIACNQRPPQPQRQLYAF